MVIIILGLLLYKSWSWNQCFINVIDNIKIADFYLIRQYLFRKYKKLKEVYHHGII